MTNKMSISDMTETLEMLCDCDYGGFQGYTYEQLKDMANQSALLWYLLGELHKRLEIAKNQAFKDSGDELERE